MLSQTLIWSNRRTSWKLRVDAVIGALVGADDAQAGAVDDDDAAVEGEGAAEQVDERRFPGAVGPDDAGHAAAGDRDREVVDGAHDAEALQQAARLEDEGAGGRGRAARS